MKKNEDVEHQDGKMNCKTNYFPELIFCGPQNKPHGVSGLSKNYHMSFDTKIGHDTCAIRHIPCVCN